VLITASAPYFFVFLVRNIRPDDPCPEELGHLHHMNSHAARRADDEQVIAGRDLGTLPKGMEGGGNGAHEGRRRLVRDIRGNGKHVSSGDLHVIGKPAVYRQPHDPFVVPAQGLTAIPAKLAGAAVQIVVDGDPVPRAYVFDRRPGLGDLSRDFVPEDPGKHDVRLPGPRFDIEHVRSAGPHFHHHFVRPAPGGRDILHPERAGELAKHHGAHALSPPLDIFGFEKSPELEPGGVVRLSVEEAPDRIPPVFLDRVIAHKSVPAEYLNGGVANAGRHLGGEKNRSHPEPGFEFPRVV